MARHGTHYVYIKVPVEDIKRTDIINITGDFTCEDVLVENVRVDTYRGVTGNEKGTVTIWWETYSGDPGRTVFNLNEDIHVLSEEDDD